MDTFESRLSALYNEATEKISELVETYGTETSFTSEKTLTVNDHELRYTLESGRWLHSINASYIFDNHGYQYDLCVIEDEKLFKIVDHLQANHEKTVPLIKKYFLFGEQAVNAYDKNDDVQDVIDYGMEFTLYIYDPSDTDALSHFLSVYEGYAEYAELTPDEYDILNKYQDEENES